MKSFRKLMSTACLTLMIATGISGQALSMTNVDVVGENRKLDQKEAQLNNLQNKADRIVNAHGRYKLIRDNHLYGSTGVSRASSNWYSEATSWLTSWYQTVEVMNNVGMLKDPTSRRQLRTDIRIRLQELKELIEKARETRGKTQLANRELGKIETFPENYLAQFEGHVQLLNSQVRKLTTALNSIEQSLGLELMNLLMTVNNTSEELILLKMKKEALQFPELEAALLDIEKMFAAEQVIYPPYHEASALYNRITAALSQYRIFAAEKLLAELKAKAADGINTIQMADIPLEEKNYGISQLEKVQSDAARVIQSKLGSGSKARLVTYYYIKSLRTVPRRCAETSASRTRYNCQLMRTLLGFDRNAIYKMDDALLEYLEQSLDRVYEGPIAKGGE